MPLGGQESRGPAGATAHSINCSVATMPEKCTPPQLQHVAVSASACISHDEPHPCQLLEGSDRAGHDVSRVAAFRVQQGAPGVAFRDICRGCQARADGSRCGPVKRDQ